MALLERKKRKEKKKKDSFLSFARCTDLCSVNSIYLRTSALESFSFAVIIDLFASKRY